MAEFAVLFPGQGSQSVGMGKDFYEAHDVVREVFDRADAALGYKLTEIMFEGPADELQLTSNTQPALLTMSIGLWQLVRDRIPATMFAGHSLGEYSAVVAAGGMDFEDAVRAVHNRGKFMQEAVPVGEGAMAAVLGIDDESVIQACREISGDGRVCEPANFNAPGQLVVAGHATAVEQFMALIKERGAKRVVKLPVSAPFHCSLMVPAQRRMEQYLADVEISDLSMPVYTNVDAAPETAAERVRDGLVRQVASPVRWTESMQAMIADGAERCAEIGAGTVLSGLAKKIDRSVQCFNIATMADMARLEELDA